MSNKTYKIQADAHHKFKEYNIGDYVLICIHPKCFPKNLFKKFRVCSFSPFQIVRKIVPNAYVGNLLANFNISSIFNIENLLSYRGAFEPSSLFVFYK